MENVITIDFTGLCVFVTNNPPTLSVILATDPDKEMKHRPVLSMNVRNVAKVENGSFDHVIQLPNGEQIASWRLDGRIVRFKGEEKAYPRGIVLHGMGIPSIPCPEDPASERELCWVPSLKRASGEGNVKAIYLKSKPIPEVGENALAARVDLTRGFVYANAEVNRRSPIESWSFPKAHGADFSQYLADTVRLEMRPEPGKLPSIEIVNFKTGAIQSIYLDSNQQLTELSITNFPEAKHEHPQSTEKLEHFRIYYRLLDPTPKNQPIPERPKSTSGPGHVMTVEAFGIRPIKCTPGLVP